MGLRVDSPGVGPSQVDLRRFRSGFYTLLGNSLTTSAGLGVSNFRCYPVEVPAPIVVARIGAEVTAVGDAGSLVRLGIYADDGNGLPGALVADAGTIPGDVVAVAEIVSNVGLSAGLYWFGAAVQNVTVTQPTLRAVTTPGADSLASVSRPTIPVAADSVLGRVSTVAGALPGVFVDGGPVGIAPRIFVKAA